VVPNALTLRLEPDQSLWADENIFDWNGHGTAVASVAAGKTHGVASNANLVIVKFRNAAKNPLNPTSDRYVIRGVTWSALMNAWNWVQDDVNSQRSKGNNGKFIINMSYGQSITPPGLHFRTH
jgi:subtilisin family serine protease